MATAEETLELAWSYFCGTKQRYFVTMALFMACNIFINNIIDQLKGNRD